MPYSNQQLEESIVIANFYFRGHTISPAVVRKNRELNKYFTVTATDYHGKVKGFIDLFCFENTTLEYLISGIRTEPDLVTSDVIAYKPGCRLYIGGFAIASNATKIEKEKIYYSIINGMLLMVKKKLLLGQDNFELYTIGYSKPGIRQLSEWVFSFRLKKLDLGKKLLLLVQL